ncbi:MAG: acyl-CoA dehydrogenase family protein [Caldilineaceae bacterium]
MPRAGCSIGLLKDNGRHFATVAGMAKLFATEVSERACRNVIQIHGGMWLQPGV